MEKLFYKDAYLKEFEAIITSCTKEKDIYLVTLDKTAFYPEGGGQPSDIGILSDANVLYVNEKNNKILHAIDKPIDVGAKVKGSINWDYRFSLMQNHSGEHIVSGIINKKYGFDNVGFHMSDTITIDFNGELNNNDIIEIEAIANEVIYQNFDIYIKHFRDDEISNLNYRSKKELKGEIRIVTFPNYDICACCGIHVKKTGEIGVIKLLSAQKHRGGTRITMLCGKKALYDYNIKDKHINNISVLLSAKPYSTSEAVERLKDENSLLKQNINVLKDKLFEMKVNTISKDTKNICLFEDDLSPNDLRNFCMKLLECFNGIVMILSGDDTIGYKYIIGSKTINVLELSKDFNVKFNGRGGGTKEMVQGSSDGKKESIQNFFNNL